MDEKEWLQAAAANPAFEFLKNQAEDITVLSFGMKAEVEKRLRKLFGL